MGCWRTINGNRVYIENCFDPWKATALVALALAAGGGGTAAGVGSVAGGSSVSVSADVGVQVKARDRSSRSVVRRLERIGLRVRPHLEVADTDCAAHSYGKVQQWFREHPCEALFRTLLEVQDRHSTLVLVAVAWVDMPNAAQASELKRLVDQPGSGNITELSREGGRYRNVHFTGMNYASRQIDNTVINAQAEPVISGARVVELAAIVRSTIA